MLSFFKRKFKHTKTAVSEVIEIIAASEINGVSDLENTVQELAHCILSYYQLSLVLIGVRNENILKDLGLSHFTDDQNILSQLDVKKTIEYNSSFVARVLKDGRFFHFQKGDDLIDSDLNFTSREISSLNDYVKRANLSLNDLMIFPLLDKNDYGGYLATFSSIKLSEQQVEEIRIISLVVKEFLLKSQAILNEKEESQIIQEFDTDDLDKSIKSFLIYLNKHFDSVMAHIWFPTLDNYDPVLIQRSIVSEKKVDSEIYRYNNLNVTESLIGQYITGEMSPTIQFYDKIGTKNRLGITTEILEKIGTRKFITIPLEIDSFSIFPDKSKVGAIICLHPSSVIDLSSIDKVRLKNLANAFESFFNLVIYKQRFNQVRTIYKYLTDISDMSQVDFYDKVTQMIKDVMNVEACSMFFYDEEGKLFLKSSTSNYFNYQDDSGIIQKKPIKEFKNKRSFPIYSLTDSITGRTLDSPREITLLNVDDQKNSASMKFRECDIGNHESFIASRLLINDRANSVVRCINKRQSGNRVINKFLQTDKDIFNLLCKIIALFVSHYEHNQSKNNFLRALAHEIKGPVSGLSGSLDLIEEYIKTDYPDKEEIFDNVRFARLESRIIKTHFDNVTHIVNKEFSIPHLYNFKKQDVKVLIERAAELLRAYSYGSKSIVLNIRVDRMPNIYVDETTFMQVIYNLLINAINYAKGSAYINVYWKDSDLSDIRYVKRNIDHLNPDKKYFELRFEDEGIGIDEGDLKRVFKKEARGKNARNTNPSGSGLGLYISNQIILAHNGAMGITSNRDPTRISVFLPTALENNPPK